MNPKVQAIIFDCFGVLTTEGWLDFKQRYFGDSKEKMQRATEINQLLNARLLGYEEGLAELAEMAGLSEPEVHRMFRDVAINTQLLDYIEHELKPSYKIGLLSNVSGQWLYTKFKPKHLHLFDAMVLSSDLGYTKPDPRAYEEIARQLGVAPDRCMFIDDQERNASGARAAGMQAIVYTDFDQCRSQLQPHI